MLIHTPRPESDSRREIRIKIPTSLHVKLHAVRLLRGTSISEAVTEALEEYFLRKPAPSLPRLEGRHGPHLDERHAPQVEEPPRAY